MSKKVLIAIGPKGEVNTNFSGYKGPECIAEAKQLESELKELGIEMDLTGMIKKEELVEEETEQKKVLV